MQQLNEEREESQASGLLLPESSQKIRLIDQNITLFKSLIKRSLTIALVRIAYFIVIIYNDRIFIGTQLKSEYSDSWSVIFYIIASLIDLLIVMNDVQLLRFLKREAPHIETVKRQIANNNQDIPNTMSGSYRNYLSIYDLIKTFKYQGRFFTSISNTIRWLEVVISFYSFGNVALNSQYQNETPAFQTIVLWIYLLSIYINVIQLDLAIAQGSQGRYVESKAVDAAKLNNEPHEYSQLKTHYIRRIRRPFQAIYLLNIIIGLVVIILFFEYSLFCLMTGLYIITHMCELIYEKRIQDKLLTVNLGLVPKKYLTSYQILREITRDNKTLHFLITSGNRIAIVLSVMAYFRDYHIQLRSKILLLTIQIILFLGQYLKFNRIDNGKLYFLKEKEINYNPQAVIECSICLLNCERSDRVIELPCFSNHVFHASCMDKWLKERKECPLCRQSLEIYQFRK